MQFLLDGIEKHVIEQVPLFFWWKWRIQWYNDVHAFSFSMKSENIRCNGRWNFFNENIEYLAEWAVLLFDENVEYMLTMGGAYFLWNWRWWHNRVIRKVRKTQHQNPEFGHTQDEIKKKPEKKYISIQGGMKLRNPSILVVNWVSSCLSFFLSASTAAK